VYVDEAVDLLVDEGTEGPGQVAGVPLEGGVEGGLEREDGGF
jgi:hypothetical protein